MQIDYIYFFFNVEILILFCLQPNSILYIKCNFYTYRIIFLKITSLSLNKYFKNLLFISTRLLRFKSDFIYFSTLSYYNVVKLFL